VSTQDSDSESTEGVPSPARRRALKIGVAATVGAVVWTEPYVVGLAHRPTYAAAASAGDLSGTTNFGPADPATFPYVETNAEGFTLTITETSNGYLFFLTLDGFDCSITAGTFTGNGSGAPNIGDEPLVINPDGSAFIDNNRPFRPGTTRGFTVSLDYNCICL